MKNKIQFNQYLQRGIRQNRVKLGGGFETLPNPVPASIMNYNHVARLISPSFTGYAGLPPTIAVGYVDTFNFSFAINPLWDINQIHIVGMLIESNGRINNGSYTTVSEAINNGFADAGGFVGIQVHQPFQPDGNFTIHPNPASDLTFITASVMSKEVLNIIIRDVTGRVIAERNYGEMTGSHVLPINTSSFPKGIYVVELITGKNMSSSKLVVQ